MTEDENGHSTDPGEDATRSLAASVAIPQQIGSHRILGLLGEGGMGIVYLAEQERPIRRRVALKLIKLGMDTAQVLARFEAEKQALGAMSHPNVAKVFDAGVTESGRPYFTMEHVQGVAITEYCDRHRLTTRQRLELFLSVCEGIQHAHQRGVIHRDIKPSNVLVSIEHDQPVPKIIDFGVAKAIQHRFTGQTVFTQLGQVIGTPEYMSPEQADLSAEDIDTRTDVYSLGATLYELLVGAVPLDPQQLRQAGFDEIRRCIREDEPSRPSTRVTAPDLASSEWASKRRTNQATLARQLRGDLDWITMMALEKDRTRRYQSPMELAADIRRHLTHRPVVAGPPSMSYRLGKFVRRHRIAVVAGSAVALALVLGTLGTSVGLLRATQAEQRARLEAKTAQRVSELLAEVLGDIDPARMGQLMLSDLAERAVAAQQARRSPEKVTGAKLAAFHDAMSGVNATDAALRLVDVEILARAGRTIRDELPGEPLIAAHLEETIGLTYEKLGLWDRAERHLTSAVEIRTRELGRDHEDTLASMRALATNYVNQGRLDEAERLLRETLDRSRRALGDMHTETLSIQNNLALLLGDRGRLDEAEALQLETLAKQRQVLGDDDPDTLTSMNNLAILYMNMERLDDAEPLFVENLERRQCLFGKDEQETIRAKNNLATLRARQGRWDEAELLQLEVLEQRRRTLGDDHPDTLNALNNLAYLYFHQGHLQKAESLFSEALERYERVLGKEHPDTLRTMNNLAYVFFKLDRLEKAEPLFCESLRRQRVVAGDDHPETIRTMTNLGLLYAAQGRQDDSDRLLLEALELQSKLLGSAHPRTLLLMRKLAEHYQEQGRLDKAEYFGAVVAGAPKPISAAEPPREQE